MTALLLLTLLLPPQEAPPGSVSDFLVTGNERVPTETILSYVEPLRGHAPGDEQFQIVFRTLWDTGLFEDLSFDTEETNTGLVLKIDLREKRLLGTVTFSGETASEEELRKGLEGLDVDLRTLRPFNKVDAQAATRILQLLLGPPYHVRYELTFREPHLVDVTFEILREPESTLAGLRFEGNESFDAPALRQVMSLQPSDWLSWITRRDRFHTAELDENLDAIAELYRSHGFHDVKVGPPKIEPQADGKVIVVIPIYEGTRYILSRVTIEPGDLLTPGLVRPWLELNEGDVYNESLVDGVVARLEVYYQNRGYPGVTVDREEDRPPGGNTIDLTLRVNDGPLFLVHRIEFEGLERVRDRDIRDFLSFDEGDRYNQRAVDAGTQALLALGTFVSAYQEVDLATNLGLARIVYHVEEIKPFEYLVGGSANGTQGVSGNGQFITRGLLGRGETMRIEADFGNRFENFAFSYQDPYSLPGRYFWSADFARYFVEYPDLTSQESIGAGARIGGPAGRWGNFAIGFRFADFTLGTNVDGFVPFLTPYLGERFRTNRLDFSLIKEGRDNPLFPTRGRSLRLIAELVGGPMGGDIDLTSAQVQVQQTMPLDRRRRHLIQLTGRVQAVWPFGQTVENGLPRFERLFLGSENDLRGFAIRGVGPRTDDVTVGGEQLWFGTVEYVLAVTSRIRLSGFFDLGNVYTSDFEGLPLPDVRYDAGAEVKILAPYFNLPIRIGYGWNLDPVYDEEPGRFFITLGVRF